MLRPKQTTSGVIVGNFFGGQHRKWFEIFSIALRAVECAFRARWPSVSVHYMTLAELFLLKNIAFGSSLIVISVPFVVSPVWCSFRRDLNSAELFTEFYSKLIFNNISLLHSATLGILWLLFFGFFADWLWFIELMAVPPEPNIDFSLFCSVLSNWSGNTQPQIVT